MTQQVRMSDAIATPPVSNAEPGCWFCDDAARVDPPPTGWLYDDGVWRAGHAPVGYSIPGTVIIEAHRHVLDQVEFDAVERASLSDAMARVIQAIKAATGCDRVYQWATMDGHPHFHVWLLPWWESSSLRGPRYLVASVFGEPTEAEPEPEHTAEMAEAIRSALR